MSKEEERIEAVRELNDRFRKYCGEGGDGVPGRIVFTSGIQSLVTEVADESLQSLIIQIRKFDEFTSDNDPYGEHDFGALDFAGARVFWKIDYYAPGMMHGAEDPTDLETCVRVLTIMLAEEY